MLSSVVFLAVRVASAQGDESQGEFPYCEIGLLFALDKIDALNME